jgi:phosphatidylinositol alpha 1,6-mannosyltransferase
MTTDVGSTLSAARTVSASKLRTAGRLSRSAILDVAARRSSMAGAVGSGGWAVLRWRVVLRWGVVMASSCRLGGCSDVVQTGADPERAQGYGGVIRLLVTRHLPQRSRVVVSGANRGPMRVVIVTESFLPQVNGVTNSVLRVCEQLAQRQHDAMVIAPGPGPTSYCGFPVVRTPSVPLPGYRGFRVARPYAGLGGLLREFDADLVHLASPTVLGAQAAFAAGRLGIPVVAVYQTDLAGFARRYHLGLTEDVLWRWLRRVHGSAARTLAPSRHAVRQLESIGVQRVRRWARGVDLQRFHPGHRDVAWRRRHAGADEVLVGYVGRLAHEKEIGLLAGLRNVAGVRVVVVGDGPARRQLERQLPGAEFVGFQSGAALSRTFASLDVFVHTGAHETFCQAAQEAQASGVPVVAPAAGGLLDLVDDGRSGLRFAPGDADDLAERVRLLAIDPAMRREMGTLARRSVEGRSWNVIGGQLVRHYREVLAA